MSVRPNWRTIVRRGGQGFPIALAVEDAPCGACGLEVLKDEPIVLIGSVVVQDEDGRRSVDLSGAEWICQRPHAA